MADKGKFPHYMIKEIFDQPQALRDAVGPRVSLEDGVVRLEEVNISAEELRALRRINIVASGTSRARRHGRPIHDPGTGEYAGRCRLRQRV